MRLCTILDSYRNVYHDAASESGMGRDTYDRLSCAGIPAVLLLNAIPHGSRCSLYRSARNYVRPPGISHKKYNPGSDLTVPGLFRVSQKDLYLITHALHVRTSDRMYKHTFF